MWTVIESPVGPLRIVERDGAITAIEFSPFRDHDGRPRGHRADDAPLLVETARQLGEYFARERTTFDLPLAPVGTSWQRDVWDQLVKIGYGQTSDEVGLVRGVSADDLFAYVDDVCSTTEGYLRTLTDPDLARIVDERWDPPVTLGVRLVSVISDDVQHAAQAAFIRGILLRR